MGDISDLEIEQTLNRLFDDWENPEGSPVLQDTGYDPDQDISLGSSKNVRPNPGLRPFIFDAILSKETNKGSLLLLIPEERYEWFPTHYLKQLEDEIFECPKWLAEKKGLRLSLTKGD